VIPARDATPTLGHVLDALAGVRLPLEAIVVDDHSADGTAGLACRHPLPTQVVRLPRRSGPGVARNVGAAVSSAATLCFLDADVVVSEAALAEHDCSATRGDVFAQGLRRDVRIGADSAPLSAEALQRLLEAGADAAQPPERERVDAAFLSLPRGAFIEVGGFDPAFARGWGYGDTHLGDKLTATGLKVELLPRRGSALGDLAQRSAASRSGAAGAPQPAAVPPVADCSRERSWAGLVPPAHRPTPA
jgi:glycosyltransferase involved in cell wall biosynthesis